MIRMQVQYVYDEQGRKTAVIVPISIWQKVTVPDSTTCAQEGGMDPDRYRGIYRGLKINFEEEIKKMRSEWERT